MFRGSARWLPSPAMAVALAALFVALAGTSYAAFALAPNSVGTPQLKNRAVTTVKLADGAVTDAKFASGAFAPQARYAINAGGLDQVTVERLHYTDSAGLAAGAQLPCPTGQIAISGGIQNSVQQANVYIDAPYSSTTGFGPGGKPNGWEFDTFNSSSTPDTVHVWALCELVRSVSGF
jgi:hypothetical protein